MKVVLKITKGPQQGREFAFERYETFNVGRSAAAQVSLPKDPAVSRNHFLIEINPPRCFIHDLMSSNGTYVNRVRIQKAMLKHNDIVSAGETRILVQVENDPDTLVLPDPSGGAAANTKARLGLEPMSAESALKNLKNHAAPVEPPQAPKVGTAPPPPPGAAGVEVELEPDNDLPAIQVPGYRLIRRLGQGGMGVVFTATENASGKHVVIKMIVPEIAIDKKFQKMFQREVELLAQLHHPNIINLIGFGKVENVDYYVMDLVQGKNLQQFMDDYMSELPPALAVDIARQVLDALQYAHNSHIVHRDLKPSNIMISERDGKLHVYVLDFGLAKNYEIAGSLTITGEVKGTFFYMAPEQVMNCKAVGPRSDLFSIGAILYHMLSADWIYDLDTVEEAEILRAILEGSVVPLEKRGVKVPPGLGALVAKALQVSPDLRFQSAHEMKNALASPLVLS